MITNKHTLMKKISVLLIDDHAVMRMGLAALLGTQHGITVVGDTGDGQTGLQMAARLKPDVAIVDLMMPEMDGVEFTRRLVRQSPGAKVLILTSFGTADGIAHALAAGASGAIRKTIELPELLAAIRAVAAGEKAISPEIRQILKSDQPIPTLSSRQSEILESVTQGFSNEEIATRLGISVPMVKEHLNLVFSKIGATNRTEAVAIAFRKHLLKI